MQRPMQVDDVEVIGSGLNRPECVLATASGDLYTSDWRGGIAHRLPDGSQRLYSGSTMDLPEGPRPNGIALEADGSFLFANLGTDVGGAWRIDRRGQIRPVLAEIDGSPLPPATNFVARDAMGRLWITVSTRKVPRSLDYRRGADSGFIIMVDSKGARIVAAGLGFTNEALVDPKGEALYVNETYARRFSRFPLKKNGDLGPKEVVTEFGPGQYPDGFAFDAEGNVWNTSVISNQVILITLSTGEAEVMLEDNDAGHLAWVEEAYRTDSIGRPHMDKMVSQKLRNISSIAFGGPDLRTTYLGCLLGDHIYRLNMPVAGVAPPHWNYPLG